MLRHVFEPAMPFLTAEVFAGKSYSQALLTQQEFLILEETFHLLCS